MRFLIYAFVLVLVSGCSVSKEHRDAYNEKWAGYCGHGFCHEEAIQNLKTIGRTSPAERRKALEECGVKNFFGSRLDIFYIYEGESESQFHKRASSIISCLQDKGYVIYHPGACWSKKRNSPTGYCN